MEPTVQQPPTKSGNLPANGPLIELQQTPPELRKAKLGGIIRELLVEFLDLDSLDEISDNQNFVELGADSMQAVDFKTQLEKLLDCSLRSTLLFDHPSLDLLVDFLMNEVLDFPFDNGQHPSLATSAQPDITAGPSHDVGQPDTIAVIAMAGRFPNIENADALWDKTLSGEALQLTGTELGFAGLDMADATDWLTDLGITPESYATMDRQQQLLYRTIADAMAHYGLSRQAFAKRGTGVFIAAQPMGHDYNAPYNIPIANKVSFQLNLKGPSEIINTFCTSVYVALHRAVQSIHAGECQQALVGGVNTIARQEFNLAAQAGLYEGILSRTNQTRSFCDDAAGYVRSEGVGVFIIKPLAQALQDGNPILALIKSTTVHHGGRGYSYEAPNPQGLKETIRLSLEKAKISPDSIDYVEAHGIGNVMADALELGAINQVYRSLSTTPGKQWHISCIKPTLGHPEMASGAASLIKAIKAFEHKTLPGLANFGTPNSELPIGHALVLQANPLPWPDTTSSRRIALNSYAIGGMNAHVILEDYAQGQMTDNASVAIAQTATTPAAQSGDDPRLAALVQEIFQLDIAQIDRSLSLVDYGFDSIKVIQFVTQLNETLGLDIKISQMMGVDDFSGFFDLLAQAQSNGQSASPTTAGQPAPTLRSSLSEVQKGLWYINETAQDPIGFNTPVVFKVPADLNPDFLRQALVLMLDGHPILKASFIQDAQTDEIIQIIRPTEERVCFQTLTLTPGQTPERCLSDLLRKPFNLKTDPLVRLYAITDAEDNKWVFFNIHHIVFDGTSGALFVHDFWANYHSLRAGRTLAPKTPELAFFDFVAWERAYLESPKALADQSWWQEQLAGQSATLNLPYDRLPQSGLPSLDIGSQHLALPEQRFMAIKAVAAALNINLSVFFLTAFQIFLYKLTQEKAIAVTTPTRGRPRQAHENSIGCYINVMVSRAEIAPEQSFASLARQNKAQFAASLDHAFYPFPKVLSSLGLTLTNPKEIPFPVSFTYQNFFDDILKSDNAAHGIESDYNIVHQQTEDNYTLEIYDFRAMVQLNIKFKRALFDDSTIDKHLDYFDNLLAEIVANPEQSAQRYEVLPAAERQRILKDFNDTAAPMPQDTCVHQLFLAQAKQTPNQTALICGGQKLTYQELAGRAQALAGHLQAQGARPDSLVAICMERSLDMLVAVFGVLMSGAAYLPIDPKNAPDRIAYMLQDGAVNLLLTQAHLQDTLADLPTTSPYQTLVVDQFTATDNGQWQDTAQASNLAYVIYTSGSTGQPKGVMIPHCALMNLAFAMVKAYRITPEDRVLQFASLSFDMSVEEIFPYLIVGAGVVIRQDQDIEADRFYRMATDHGVSILNLPPLFYNVIDALDNAQKTTLFGQVRLVSFGGEALPEPVLNAIRHYPVTIFNAYGPTEYTVNAALADLTESTRITIGKPIINTQLYVLGEGLGLMPVGTSGELHIAGAGIALGYLNQPELTAEKFVPNPFGPGKLYKTGDTVRWLPDGTIEYLGRSDDQVKIRGFRVELGEIERAISAYPGIETVVAIAQDHNQGKQLVAFYVGHDDIDAAQLKSDLRKRLPDYMLPSALVRLDAIPVTANGKADRKALENQTVAVSSDRPYVAATNEIEAGLAEIWASVLGIPQVGIHDDFFALGGHSLLAIQIVLRANKKFAVNLSLSSLFDAGDIQHLAEIIAQSEQAIAQDTLGDFAGQSEEVIF